MNEGCRLFFSFRHPKITAKEKIDIGSNNPRKIRSYLCFFSFYFRIRVQQEQETCLVSFRTCGCLFKTSLSLNDAINPKKQVCLCRKHQLQIKLTQFHNLGILGFKTDQLVQSLIFWVPSAKIIVAIFSLDSLWSSMFF